MIFFFLLINLNLLYDDIFAFDSPWLKFFSSSLLCMIILIKFFIVSEVLSLHSAFFSMILRLSTDESFYMTVALSIMLIIIYLLKACVHIYTSYIHGINLLLFSQSVTHIHVQCVLYYSHLIIFCVLIHFMNVSLLKLIIIAYPCSPSLSFDRASYQIYSILKYYPL